MRQDFSFEIIAHSRQVYDTCGNYFRRGKAIIFQISRTKDPRYSLLVLLHEFIEYMLCRFRGVKLKDIDRFDLAYEKARAARQEAAPCGCRFQEDPGDDLHCPYRAEHQVATACEKLLADFLGVSWLEYEEAIVKLSGRHLQKRER